MAPEENSQGTVAHNVADLIRRPRQPVANTLCRNAHGAELIGERARRNTQASTPSGSGGHGAQVHLVYCLADAQRDRRAVAQVQHCADLFSARGSVRAEQRRRAGRWCARVRDVWRASLSAPVEEWAALDARRGFSVLPVILPGRGL